jgi:hypothetical protein
MATQRTKGKVTINSVKGRLAPGNSDLVRQGEFRHRSGVMPEIKKAAKYDHGNGPEDFTHMHKSFGKGGPSQNNKQVYISKRGTKLGK